MAMKLLTGNNALILNELNKTDCMAIKRSITCLNISHPFTVAFACRLVPLYKKTKESSFLQLSLWMVKTAFMHTYFSKLAVFSSLRQGKGPQKSRLWTNGVLAGCGRPTFVGVFFHVSFEWYASLSVLISTQSVLEQLSKMATFSCRSTRFVLATCVLDILFMHAMITAGWQATEN